MTLVAVTEQNVLARIEEARHSTSVQGEPVKVAITDGTDNPPQVTISHTLQATTLTAMRDVDTTGAVDGSLLIYKGDSQKWKADSVLRQALLDGGNF
jgi:hypothetical protein